jgi:DNA-binding transcriptional MerR regulator
MTHDGRHLSWTVDTATMGVLLSIGDFSRMTHLSVKALRHYHEFGLLEPASIDRASGYRFYDVSQVPLAQVVRRLRDLGMPLDQVKSVLDAPDVEARNKEIAAHLTRMEHELAQTRETVAGLRALLTAPPRRLPVEFRSIPATQAVAIRERVTVAEFADWWGAAFAELHAVLRAADVSASGPSGALYPGELFEQESGEMTAFMPVAQPPATTGRVEVREIPSLEAAVTMHEGAMADLDIAYAALGAEIAERGAIGVDGPIREYYLVGPFDTENETQHRTEVCWPVFRTAPVS